MSVSAQNFKKSARSAGIFCCGVTAFVSSIGFALFGGIALVYNQTSKPYSCRHFLCYSSSFRRIVRPHVFTLTLFMG